MEHFVLPDALAREMCDRLGAKLPGSFAEIAGLYERWRACVPFDPVAKALALREDRTPPGADPVEFCERWLATGVGGTCWGHVAGLAGILGAAGIETSVGLDRMVRDIVDFHSFLVVTDADRRYALDPIHASGSPLPIEAGARSDHGPYQAGIERDGGRLIHWFRNPQRPTETSRYVLLSTDLDADDVRAFCLVSSRFSGVTAHRFFHRCFPADAFVASRPNEDGTRLSVRRSTRDDCTITEIDDLDSALSGLGYSPEGIDMVERAGLVRTGPDGRRRLTT